MADKEAQSEAAGRDAFLRGYLAERDEPCPMCEYNLRGLTGAVCPECGESLRIRVSLREPKMGLYLCGVIGWAVGVGFSGLLLVTWVLPSWIYGGYNAELRFTWTLWFQIAVQGPMMGLSVWKGRWIRRRSQRVRWCLAVAAWIISIGLAFSFFAVVD
ncbi:MAG: hypothetical protein IIB55_09310 [Planctomycetes bacterium]|nr:hypothetical protein [Planctomycetota bacterium]MCH9058811.1 hypothetical protein [Planctomycetota bacterium]